jgi:hypothetical protein
MTKEISLDQPLLEQAAVREILFPEKEGLIPNLMLERLLEITRVLVQNQLEQKFQNYELANLVVGYDVFTKDKNCEIPEQTPQRFSVEWNDSKLIENVVDNSELKDLGSSLSTALQSLLIELISKSLNDRKASIYLSFTVIQSLKNPSISPVHPKPDPSLSLESTADSDDAILLESYRRECKSHEGFHQWIENGIPTGIACP